MCVTAHLRQTVDFGINASGLLFNTSTANPFSMTCANIMNEGYLQPVGLRRTLSIQAKA